MSYGTVQAEKMTTESGYSLGAGNASSFKNRIINGGMVIDQRNGGSSVSISSAANTYTIDRWRANAAGGGVFSVQRSSTAPAGFTNSILATVTTADSSIVSGDFYHIRQSIEGFNFSDLGFGTASAQPVTVSFWVRSSVTGSFSVLLRNEAGNRGYLSTYTINAANTFEYKTLTIPGDTSGTWATDNTSAAILSFNLGTFATQTPGSWLTTVNEGFSGMTQWISNSGATFFLTGVQLEVGTVATSFDYRPYATEYQLCLRYTFVWSSFGGSFIWLGSSGFTTGTGASVNYVFPVQMRATPTTSFSEQNKWIADYFNGNATSTAINASFGSPNSVRINITASPPANYPCFIANNGDAGTRTITFNSEL